MGSVAFRFDALNHEYLDIDTGQVFPHITGMLEATGWIDDRWYTEESSARGKAVHRLSADYDLGALDVESCESRWRSWLLAYIKATQILQPVMLTVEEPLVHPRYRFGGRPDRIVKLRGHTMRAATGVLEVKTGSAEKSHQVQTALQAILIADDYRLRPEAIDRHCLYIRENGKFKLTPHTDRRDFDEAQKVLAKCITRAA